MTKPSNVLHAGSLDGPDAAQSVVSLLQNLGEHAVVVDDEAAMREALGQIFPQLPESLTVQSLYDALISAGTHILAEGHVDYPLPVNGKFRALLDDDTIWWNIAAIGMLIPIVDGEKGDEWNEERENNWDIVVDATYQVLHDLWEQDPYHVWYGERLLQTIQERLLKQVPVMQLSIPSVALLKNAAQDNKHPYARLLTFMLKVCRDHADVHVFGVGASAVTQTVSTKPSPASSIKRVFAKLRGKALK